MPDNPEKKIIILISLVMIVLVLIVYWPVQKFEFVNYDDPLYVTDNHIIQSGLNLESIKRILTDVHTGHWHPVTMMSHMLDWQLFRNRAGGHHWTSVIIHLFNTLLLFLFFRYITGAIWRSAFIAALFAIHPINVESVAWVAERKNVLSTFFWILTMILYACYVKSPNWKRYMPMLFCFALGLMSKPMLVTLPFVLLLLDYWPLQRIALQSRRGDFIETTTLYAAKKSNISSLIIEKTPLFVLAIISSCITFYAARLAKTTASLDVMPLTNRIYNAIVAYAIYIRKMVWPFDLAVFYPHTDMPLWQISTAVLLLLGITILVCKYSRKYPYLLVGWFWYLGTLLPVIGLVQAGAQSMADRYAYVSFIGLFLIIVWIVADIQKKWGLSKKISHIISGGVFLILLIVSVRQVTYWENGISLFQHAIDISGGNRITLNNLGAELTRKGRLEEAMMQYHKAIHIQSDSPDIYNNIAKLLMLRGKTNEAIVQYNKALQLQPQYAMAHFNIGVAYSEVGRLDEAAFHYSEAARIKPDFFSAYNNLGIVYARKGELDKAILNFQKTLMIFPNFESAKNNLRIAMEQKDALSPTSRRQ